MNPGLDVSVRGLDTLQSDLRRAAGDLPDLDLSEITTELRDVAAAGAPRRTGAGVASLQTGQVGGVETFSVGLLYMSVQEWGDLQHNLRGKHFVGHALDVMRGGRADAIADREVSDLLTSHRLGR